MVFADSNAQENPTNTEYCRIRSFLHMHMHGGCAKLTNVKEKVYSMFDACQDQREILKGRIVYACVSIEVFRI